MNLWPINCFLQKLLFTWVKTTSFPKQPDIKKKVANTHTVYVLADRGLSDLLVLQQTAKKLHLADPQHQHTPKSLNRSVYSITSNNPIINWLIKRKNTPSMMQELLSKVLHDENFNVRIIPVSVFWGRPLAKQKHWLMVLFTDTWAIAGKLRRFFTIILHGKRCEIFFSEAINLRDLAEKNQFSEEKINHLLTAVLLTQREVIFGPAMVSHPVLRSQVLATKTIQKQIENKADKDKISLAKANKVAQSYCDEIFTNCTQITINLMLRLLNKFWNKFYSGISVYNFNRVKNIAKTHQLVYVPCHRSHIDYLLLSYVIHQQGLAIPYIAAGKNLNLPIIGRILRGGGAFFIRRSFKGNVLYAKIMDEYIKKLVELGTPIEYFIEGGRSRTGRLLQPMLGMLAMTVQAYLKTQQKPMAFIPVYIGYEKLMEGSSYLGELYGHKKKKETLIGSLAAIYKLKGQFGKVSTSFGKPILLDEILHHNNLNWQQESSELNKKPQWYLDSVNQLSRKIMQNINHACVLNPVNLIATILLATPRQSIDQKELIEQAGFYTQLIRNISQLKSIIVAEKLTLEQLDRIKKQGLIHYREHSLGDIIYLNPNDSVLMSYYRNNSLHAFIIPSLIACCFINARQMSKEKLTSIVHYVYPFLKAELHLEWSISELDYFIENILKELIAQNVLFQTKQCIKRPDRSDHNYLQLIRLAQIVQPILERHYMTFIILWQSESVGISEKQLEERCHLIAQKISMIYGINSPDFFDRKLFSQFIKTLFELGYIQTNEHKNLHFTPSFTNVNLDIRALLSIEVRSSILQILTVH